MTPMDAGYDTSTQSRWSWSSPRVSSSTRRATATIWLRSTAAGAVAVEARGVVQHLTVEVMMALVEHVADVVDVVVVVVVQTVIVASG